MNFIPHEDLAYAYPKLDLKAIIRQQPSDFQVDEIPVVSASGEGEHALLHIRKIGLNTEQVARTLAKLAEVRPMAVSYAGQKDRHAVTTQFFSVHLPGKTDPDWSALNSDELQILSVARHSKKLKRGALKGNRFRIRLVEFKGDTSTLAERVATIKQHAVPNYFGEQRFGYENSNLLAAIPMFQRAKKVSRHQRSMILSAVRSYLFNQIVSKRVEDHSWNKINVGDFAMLEGSHGGFRVESIDQDVIQRNESFEIHSSAAMFGEGEFHSRGNIQLQEDAILSQNQALCDGLTAARLKMERRAMRLAAKDIQLSIEQSSPILSFSLPRGTFATSVLREILLCS